MLREVDPGDLLTFYEHQRDPAACMVAAFTPRELPAFLEHWKTKILGSPTVIARSILLGGKLAGYVSSFEAEGQRLVCYWIGREFWGGGVASKALKEFVEKIERTRPLAAFVATSNPGSIRVLEKCGFVQVPGSVHVGDDGVEEVRFSLSPRGGEGRGEGGELTARSSC